MKKYIVFAALVFASTLSAATPGTYWLTTGTAFPITDNGYVVTNCHVMHARPNMYVIINGTKHLMKEVASDCSHDIVIAKIDARTDGWTLSPGGAIEDDMVTIKGYGGGNYKIVTGKVTMAIPKLLIKPAGKYPEVVIDGHSGSPVIKDDMVVGYINASANILLAERSMGYSSSYILLLLEQIKTPDLALVYKVDEGAVYKVESDPYYK